MKVKDKLISDQFIKLPTPYRNKNKGGNKFLHGFLMTYRIKQRPLSSQLTQATSVDKAVVHEIFNFFLILKTEFLRLFWISIAEILRERCECASLYEYSGLAALKNSFAEDTTDLMIVKQDWRYAKVLVWMQILANAFH